jgi:hypothetical protein
MFRVGREEIQKCVPANRHIQPYRSQVDLIRRDGPLKLFKNKTVSFIFQLQCIYNQ